MTIHFSALPTDIVRDLQSGGLDAYSQVPETSISDGPGNPCRHCLGFVPKGDRMLILAHRPFPEVQPYAETGPIFLCAENCVRYEAGRPPIFDGTSSYLIKGYGANDRIVYGTGRVIPTERMETEAEDIFRDPRVAYIHVRSARNNCYQCRIDRA